MDCEHMFTVDIVDVQHAADYFGPTVLLCGGEVPKQWSYQRYVFDETTQNWSNYVCFRENLSTAQESQNYQKPTKITRFQDWRMFKSFCRSWQISSFFLPIISSAAHVYSVCLFITNPKNLQQQPKQSPKIEN